MLRRDQQSDRQEGRHASKHDTQLGRSGLRAGDREASGSGQWHRSGELQSDQDWQASRDYHHPTSHEHDTYQ